ncbi:phage terminase large subunit family protein [Roseomonas populi]|uniref:Phage terminase large subunit family protein n=1 Tax=Roseomonas populi TaxID=3121582 RepID=A0ABT1X120_9PROT|nr:phage terminase large subunit family protein [Roseomonas pecuniae]MCR0981801.1 phage terminase large subunit family protein [Roseomonas pecuniae]
MKSPTNPPTSEPFPVEGAVVAAQVARWFETWKPRKRLSLSEWSAQHARLESGKRYRAFPFQNGIADAFTDPAVRQITVMKSSRIGYSQIVQNYVAYCIHQAPTRLLIYQPTIDDAETYSKDDLEPVLQWPAVRERVVFKPRHPDNKLRAKRFPGGWVQIKGANSPKEFRRVTADKVLLEEPDGYPPTAGREGDQAALAFKRCLTSDDPLKAAGSTPTVAGASRVEKLFQEGTQEHRYVPCPHCGHMQVLVFGDGTGPGIRWEPRENPTRAYYRCAGEAACEIEEDWKAWMDERGEWRAHAPQNGPRHRSFHIWSGYSQFEGAAWLELAREFLAARKDPLLLMPFVNQVLGETWKVKGDAPQWRRLYDRRSQRQPGLVPRDALLLTGGIDVQGNRIEVFIWGWAPDKRSFLVDHRVVPGNPFLPATWEDVSKIITGAWRRAGGAEMRLSRVGADIGFATTHVLAWARKHPGLVIPVKGASNHHAPVFAWSDSRDPGPRGGKRKRGQRIGMVGGTILTQELYGLLNLDAPTEEDAEQGVVPPPGYVDLNGLATEEFCKQLVGLEWLEKSGEWKKVHPDEALDGWKYARAMMTAIGADRWTDSKWRELREAWDGEEPPPPPRRGTTAPPGAQEAETPPPPAAREGRRQGGGWFNGPRRGYFGGGR